MSDTIRYDGGLGEVPEEVRAALAFAAHEAERTMDLSNGETALFFNLISTVRRHRKDVDEPG